MECNHNKNSFYVIVAASAVGKSTLVNQLIKDGLWTQARKYSTRIRRDDDDDIINIDKMFEQESLKVQPSEKQLYILRRDTIQNICGKGQGVVYFKNNDIYGINIGEVSELLSNGKNVVSIVSDFHVIENLKNDCRLNKYLKVVYIASSIDERVLRKRYNSREPNKTQNLISEKSIKIIQSIEDKCSVLMSAARLKYIAKIEAIIPDLSDEWNEFAEDYSKIKARASNIRLLYNRYIDNIAMIDYALLNFYDIEYMFSQMRNIIDRKSKPEKQVIGSTPMFFVCAAPSSGKATLMEIIGDLGKINDNIVITHKYAKREERPATDGRDGMIAITENGDFVDYINAKKDEHSRLINSDDLWSWHFHNNSTEYAVSKIEIQGNIDQNMPQIFISNMGQIANAKQLYPNNVVVLYLHATHETETLKHIKKKRIETELGRYGCSYEECDLDKILDQDVKSIFDAKIVDTATSLEALDRYKSNVAGDQKEIKGVHYDFKTYVNDIDHILLNTGTKEDLVEQMRNLIKHYTNS